MFEVVSSEAKEGMLLATARTSHVDPGVKHTPGRFLRRCGPSLLPFLFWGVAPAPQVPDTSGQLLPISFGQGVSPKQKVPWEPLGDQGPGMQLELAGHGPGDKSACWAWILICKVSPQ